MGLEEASTGGRGNPVVPEMSVMKRNSLSTPARSQRLTYSGPSSQTAGSSFTEQVTLWWSEAPSLVPRNVSWSCPRDKALTSGLEVKRCNWKYSELPLTLGGMGDVGFEVSGGLPLQQLDSESEFHPSLLSLPPPSPGAPDMGKTGLCRCARFSPGGRVGSALPGRADHFGFLFLPLSLGVHPIFG